MRILALSDSHGSTIEISLALKFAGSKVDLVSHSGDGVADLERVGKKMNPLRQEVVRGNQDFDSSIPLRLVVGNDTHPILIIHGHNIGLERNWKTLLNITKELKVGVAIFGHTHIPTLIFSENTYLINPGSISRPRQSNFPSFAIIEVSNNIKNWCTVSFFEILVKEKEIRPLKINLNKV